MDHIHYIHDRYGWFRNVICRSCNCKRADNKINSRNETGYKLIYKDLDNHCKQGFIYKFQVSLEDGKTKIIKSSINLDYLIKFRDKWTKENNYYC